MQQLLTGKTALVTGGASGIGRAASLAFAREGARVCVADRNSEMAEATAAEIVEAGGQAIAIGADMAIEHDVREMVEKAAQVFGTLDCCFNNAGIGTRETNSRAKLLANIALADWQRQLDVNLTGVFLCLKYQLLQMQEQGRGGAIVNNASIGGMTALFGAAAYTASKHGVLALTKSAAIEYGALGIRVNAVCPGHILTPLLGSRAEISPDLPNRNPMHRLGTAEEIAELVVWLSSSRASFTNGAAYLADGGRLAGG